MAGITEDRDRQVVPRWRKFKASLQRGELSSLRIKESQLPSTDSLKQQLDDWNTDKTVSVAADLVSSAFTLGLDGVASEAAEFVLANSSTPRAARSLAAHYLKREDGQDVVEPFYNVLEVNKDRTSPSSLIARKFQLEIHKVREQLVEFPWNPILWSNLSLLFTTVNAQEKASRAMRCALSLAGENRLVLRSASRLLLHQGKAEEAHKLLTSSTILTSDPWILSAEIATAAANKKTSKLIKHAHKVLEAGRVAPLHLSELASALGTMEARAGKSKAGRRLIEKSLKMPTENALAQAAWLSRNVGLSINANYTESNEASAWSCSRSARWDDAILEAYKWQEDQPFSSRPAIFGSHMAGVLEDYDQAILFARQGILSNSDDFTLHNNLAFALLMRGNISEARETLSRLKNWKKNTVESVTLSATTGLLHFRMGEPVQGRLYYNIAISIAQKYKLDKSASLASIYLALEEIKLRSSVAGFRRNEAIQSAASITEPWVSILVERLKRSSVPVAFS